MKERLDGYNALITGGSSGIGYEMSKQLLSQGATVIISSRAGERLDEAEKNLSAYGDVHAVPMDVRDEDSVTAAARQVKERFGHLDMAVSNAGIGNNAGGMVDLPPDHGFWEIPVSAVKAVIETNFIGYFIVASRFVPLMQERGGSLVYVSTSDSTMTRPGQLPYGPSKAGAEAMSTIMADEMRSSGIRVNVICPGGFTDTAMASDEMKERFRKGGGSILPPSILNRVISFLASPVSEGIHGEKIVGREFDRWLVERGIRF